MKFTIDHFNINVLDLEKSLTFYNKAPGLKKMGIYFINDPDGYWLEIAPVR